ncbi:class I fructose-bisphosphate aldolase [Spiribacter roseus]|jgi:fructose-bisphosphate aldolase class I|uniref:class I fructose-bisphosphate aldolase n=1 Tax=Spiribacter roseus TaxID=1855875 RepID=UPI00132FCD0E|nr:class I fructose-bisphosphate aldolase [Spiribacter roseus]KAF0283263.1 fructose-bisphosphate aldolase [Spiribacter roseus]
MDRIGQMQHTIERLTRPGRGILAADESYPTITKRLSDFGIESTEETRRFYRSLLATTPGIGEYVGGIIFFEETLGQRTDEGQLIPAACEAQDIVPGIKVDKGAVELAGSDGEKVTQGLDNLGDRLDGYVEQGALFTKWRNLYQITPELPSRQALEANAEVLARYAAIAQSRGMVPIVEPEVLMDGDHDLARCAAVTEAAQATLFEALRRHRVLLEAIILKPNMVLPGKGQPRPAVETCAEETLRVLRRTVPAAVPSINFLSGGQTSEEATAHLNAMNQAEGPKPWVMSFSFSRALQNPVQAAWAGVAQNKEAAQQAFLHRARLNSLAREGRYTASMETDQA